MKVYTTLPHGTILSAISAIDEYIRPTYGPSGRGILIDQGFEQHVIDDGFAALEELELEDELENAVVKYVKDASRKTNKRAGDGTTTSLLLTAELIRQSIQEDEHSLTKPDYVAIAEELRTAGAEAIKALKPKKIKTVEDLQRIAQNSYRNPEVANLIATLVHTVGTDGSIAIENSDTLETSSEVVSGLHIDRGYISQHMSAKGQPNELKNPTVIITDETITNLDQENPLTKFIVGLMNEGKKDIFIIAENVDGQALATITINNLQGRLNVVAIKAPGFGDKRYDLLEDIASVVNATVLTKRTGRPLSSITKEDCGTAKTITVSQDDTLIVGGAGTEAAIKARIEHIRPQTEKGGEFDRKLAKDRIASLSGGVGVIRVGAPTENEQAAVKMKVEDALHATQHAFKEGVVKGAGLALAEIKTSSERFNAALQYPRAVLLANGKHFISKDAEDAAVVVKAALESAVSVATTLLTAGGIITDMRDDKEDD